MKNILIILMLVGMISCNHEVQDKKSGPEGKPLPSFNVLLMDSTRFNIGKIPEGKSIVLFFFGPSCPYCQELSKDIMTHIDQFRNTRIFLLSSSAFPDIKAYDSLFKLDKHANITVAQDYTDYFFSYFKGPGIPYLAIYDKKKKFKRIVLGGVKADSILHIING
jgi:thioredoxin-related protein